MGIYLDSLAVLVTPRGTGLASPGARAEARQVALVLSALGSTLVVWAVRVVPREVLLKVSAVVVVLQLQ